MSAPAASIQPLVQVLARARYAFGLLLLVTILSLTWHRHGMERVVELAGGRFVMQVEDDRATGGASKGALGRQEGLPVMRCQLVKKSDYPYCKLSIDLTSDLTGIDMSTADQLNIDLGYQGPGIGRLSISLINAEEGLTTKERWETYKVNQIDGLDVPPDGKLVMPFRWLSVPPWWKDLARPPLEHSFVRVDNVVRVELVAGGWAAAGEHAVTIKSIRLHSKWISQNTLLMCLVGMWILGAVGWLTATALTLSRQLRASDAALALLGEVNSALELEARELADQAQTDPLTGVLNRQGLRAALMGNTALMADPMSVIFIDIDHFKSVNDTHGHDMGDQVLRAFAQVIGSGIRSADRLVRWGGEEFLIVCPLTDAQQAVVLAETLRQALHRQAWPGGLRVTASFGVARHHRGEEIGAVIKHADQQLYRAKASGRDRVCAHGQPAPLATAA